MHTLGLSPAELAAIDREQAARFADVLVPAAEAICPQYGIDPRVCVAEAIAESLCGTVGMFHNYWNLPGAGDAGSYATMVARRTGKAAGGGFEPQMMVLARYSCPETAVEAWCRAMRGL